MSDPIKVGDKVVAVANGREVGTVQEIRPTSRGDIGLNIPLGEIVAIVKFNDGAPVLVTLDALKKYNDEPMLQFFEYAHLPEGLQAVSRPFGELAEFIATLPRNAERTVALRKLLEAKDCAVRAKLARPAGDVR